MKAYVGRALSREELEARVPKDRRGELAYWIDRALAFRFDPSETLVISGFWRSGTTWLEESLRDILRAKILFEPLDPLARDAQAVYADHHVAGKTHEFLRMYMPYCGDATLSSRPLRELFRRALCSESHGSWVRRFRKGWAESFRPRLVVKFVNAQLCLRAAQNTFGMPVLHVYRDPRAVIASIRKTRFHWLFDYLSLREQLLDVPDGRAEYFGQWRDEILRYDRYDPVARVAAYWSLTERFLQASYAGYQGRFVCVSYEKLAQGREQVFSEVLKKLGLRPWQEQFQVSEKDSPTTSNKQRGASITQRVAGWKNELSPTEIAMIESVVNRLGLADRLMNEEVEVPREVAGGVLV